MKSLKIYALLLFFCIAGICACKKDLGNYNFTDVDAPTRDTLEIPAAYNIEQFADFKVDPKINYQGDEANLSYQWLAYPKSSSGATAGVPTIISDQKMLDVKLNLAPGNYYLELVITDKTNGLKTTSRNLLNVLALIENGWLVLHSQNAESDVDFITNGNLYPGAVAKRLTNILSAQNGGKMKGEGLMIGYSRRVNTAFNWITVSTEQELKRFNSFNFTFLSGGQQLFRRTQTAFDFAFHLNNFGNELIIGRNGKLFGMTWTLVQEALYPGVFNGDYNLAPYMAFNDFGPLGGLVYDQKNSKFMYTTQIPANLTLVDFRPAVSGQPFNLANVGKDILFMDRGFGNNAYAFFKDKTGNGRWFYIVNLQKPDAGDLALAAHDMTALPEIQDAKFFQVGDLGNVALYATERNIYSFDYSGSQTATQVFSGIPAGEVITSMKIYKPKLNGNNIGNDFATTNNTVLYVATWNGSEGKLYELRMNVASGALSATPLNVYTGFGRIKDMIAKFRGTGI